MVPLCAACDARRDEIDEAFYFLSGAGDFPIADGVCWNCERRIETEVLAEHA